VSARIHHKGESAKGNPRWRDALPQFATAFSPDGRRVLTMMDNAILPPAGSRQNLCIWDAASGERLVSIKVPAPESGKARFIATPADRPAPVMFSPDGQRLLAVSSDRGYARLKRDVSQ
jgi:hypothetical protein